MRFARFISELNQWTREVPPPSASGLQPYATGLTCHYAAKLRFDSFRDFDHTGKTLQVSVFAVDSKHCVAKVIP
jgi:hypothetical protein